MSWQTATAQTNKPVLYPAQIDWLEENNFPVHIYQWNYNTVNVDLFEAIEKKSVAHLMRGTINWLELTVGERYESQDAFRSKENMVWLRKRNIHIEYYDGAIPEDNEMLNRMVKNHQAVEFTKVLGITVGSIGAGVYLISLLQASLNILTLNLDAVDTIEKRSRIGMAISLSGFATFFVNRLLSGGNRKQHLQRFSKRWYQRFEGY